MRRMAVRVVQEAPVVHVLKVHAQTSSLEAVKAAKAKVVETQVC